MNILVGCLSLAMLVFLKTSSRVPAEIHLSAIATATAATTAGFLVFASVMALLGKPRWRRLMLLAAVSFYGSIMVQNALLLAQAEDSLVPASKLTSHLIRSGLEVAINLWALLSPRTRQYFDRELAAP
ncbi:hypothetical protein [Agrilutibacter solisilvae]|uniref:Uncharacterized protein n=1 Tax=Agrilutibacter solisilvae TaxID=2763317 RepID=A0A975AU34_9GAMM|nr:hypothetical protein [Lysobacter solisilvae]QSX79720.1 hypothetical protein I8J32_007750 [Lysobacter solisilvae]